MRLVGQEFKSFFKDEKKPKKDKKAMWIDLKKRAFDKQKKKLDAFVDKDTAFYNEIWKERLHLCERCGGELFGEWRKWNFHHLLLKSKRPDLRYEKNNVILVCLQCHSNEHS